MKLKYVVTTLILIITCFSVAVPAQAGIPGTIVGNVKFRDQNDAIHSAAGQIVSKQGGHFEGNTYVKFEGSVSSRTDSLGRYIFSNDPEEKIVSTDATSAAKNYMYYLCSWSDTGATRCADRSIDQPYISCINSSCPLFTLTANSNPVVAGFNTNDTRFNDVCSNYIRSSNPPNIVGGNNIGNWCGGNCDGRINQTYLFVRHVTPPEGYRVKGQNYLVSSAGSEPIDSPTVLVTALNGPGVNPQDIIIDIELIPIDGVCNSSFNGSNQSDLTANTLNLCSAGPMTDFIATATGWTWKCGGLNGGATPLCSANRTIPPVCNSALTNPTYTEPTGTLCTSGLASSITHDTINHRWTWTCNGAFPSSSVTCQAPEKINGICGTASTTTPYATTVSSYPTNSTICGVGSPTPSPVPFPAPGQTVNWTCSGINGGVDSPCNASRYITCYRCTSVITDPANSNDITTNTLTCNAAEGWQSTPITTCPTGSPAMTLLKDVKGGTATDYLPADTTTGPKPIIDANAQVQYRYTAENTGNVTLTNVVITDQLDTANGHLTLSNFVCTVGNQSRSMPTTLGIGEKLICTAFATNGVLESDIQNTATLNAKYNNVALTPVTNPAHYDSRKLACQAACTQSAQCTTNYCSPTTHKCVNETYPTSTDCQTPPAQALLTEKRIISMIDTLDGSRTISYMITVKNISTTEDVENVQITDDLENNAATGPVTLVPGSLYGINLRSAQISTTFNGVTNKAMLAVNAGTTNLTLKKYPSSESYASVIYAVTYPLGTRSSASICDKAVVTGTNVISQFGSTSSDIKCIDITATPSPSPTTPPPPPPTTTVSPSPTAITPSVTIPPVTPTLTPTPAKIDLKLIKSVDKSKIKIGDRVEFTITIANESAVGALNVKVKDLLTSSFAYLSHETSYGQYDQASGIWTIGNLNALATQTLKIKALVVTRDTLTNLAEVYQAEQPDSDSSPNNCDGGKNKEDDCADVALTYDGVVAGVTTKGGTLADTGNSLIAPLVFGVLGFGALFIVLKLRSKHALIIKVSNPGADSAARELLSRLLVHQTIAGGVVVASALLVGVSILNVANTVQLAQLKRASGGLDSSLTMVAAEVAPIEKSVTFDCGVASPTEISMTKDSPMRLTMVNSNADAHAFITLPGYDVLTQSSTISQQDANDDYIHEVSGEKAVTFVPKTSGTWYLTNASYCKKANKTNSFNIPTLIVGAVSETPDTRVSKVSGAYSHTCAIQPSGKLICWGDYYQNPDGIPVDRIPEQVTDATTVTTGDSHTCAIQSGGDLYCWGASNIDYQYNVPDDVAHGAESVASFWSHTCAIKTGGKLYCWGLYDYDLENPADVPEDLANLTFTKVSTGVAHTCAIQSGGKLHCWGDNSDHQTDVPEELLDAIAVTTGDYHTCAIQSGGKLHCWGDNNSHQTDVPEGLSNVIAVTAGDYHTCAIQSGGKLHCWGDNADHQTDVPQELTNAVVVSAGQEHTCAVQYGGQLYCWGFNDYGQTTIPPQLISDNSQSSKSQSSAPTLKNNNKIKINRRLKK